MVAALLTDALANLATTTGESAAVFNYSDAYVFSQLWATKEDGRPSILTNVDNKAIVILVWQDVPTIEKGSPEDLLKPHLTPIDWALAFSNVVIESKDVPVPDLRIHIIDLTGKKYEAAWSVRMRYQLLAEMPWVTLHAPLLPIDGDPAPYREKYHAILEGTGAEPALLAKSGSSWQFRSEKPRMPDGVRRGWGKGLKDLARQWAASLTQSMQHHDVNNVIGADILARPERRRGGLFGAFLTRLSWTGYNLHTAANWKERDVGNLGSSDTPIAYVVDDHLQQGWARFLHRLLNHGDLTEAMALTLSAKNFHQFSAAKGNPNEFALYGCPSPLPLIDFLEDRAIFDRRDYGSQLRHGEVVPELLLLDLRLYDNDQEARKHARRLLDVVDRKLASPQLAWQAIDRDEIERIREWANGNASNQRSAEDNQRSAEEALLVLPRLLALALPLTPIILFSSTGQAWIRDRLKPYQNIFTGFEKPRVLSNPESIEASIAALYDALENAVKMMRLRLCMAHAQAAIEKADQERPYEDRRLTDDHHVEIYVDETLNLEKGIVSGAAVCIFPNAGSAETLQERLWREHDCAGTVWARQPNGEDPKLSKGRDIVGAADAEAQVQVSVLGDLLKAELGAMSAGPRALWSVVATRNKRVSTERPELVSVAAFPDGPLDEVLRFNIEFILYGLIPYFSKTSEVFNGTIQIHLPTRVVPRDDEEFTRKLCKAFDLPDPEPIKNKTTEQREWLIHTTPLTKPNHENASPVGSTFPLVRGWLLEYQDTTPGKILSRIVKIKTTTLSRGTDKEKGINATEAYQRRLLHDIADWACMASINSIFQSRLQDRGIFPNWFTNTNESWFERLWKSTLTLMQAVKASLREERGTDALRLVLRSEFIQERHPLLLQSGYFAQQRVLLWMLRRTLSSAKGEDLHALLVSTAEPKSAPLA